MKPHKIWLGSGLALMLALSLLTVSLMGPAALAQDGNGGPNIPTPTPHPVDNVDYELTRAGGEDVTLTFPGLEEDGFTVSETTVTSNYPRGMEFRVAATSDNGQVVDALLLIRLISGSNVRFQATFDEETEEWVARPWDTGAGQPAWTAFDFYWRIRDESGAFVETDVAATDYWDPTREWWRMESQDIILYWFGFEEVEPDYVAENAAYAMAATEPRRVAGFGGPLSYKPIGVIYPTRDTLAEIFGSGQSNSNAAGWTSSDLGMTIQHISMPTDDWFERQSECIYLTPREERTEQWRAERTVFGTVPHEVAHLYQYDKGVSLGPNWWIEGQADYFTYQAGDYDSRIRHLSSLQDIDNLQGNISAFTFEADGCYALAYDLGVSFINWLLTNYGGLEAHAQIVELLGRNVVLADAVEQVTGKPFIELQNEWRAYLGFRPLALADLDPASALEDPVDPLYVVGDVFTVPGPRPLSLQDNPGPAQISTAACFPNLQVEVLAVGQLDGVNYYQVTCSGLEGWVPESALPTP